MNGTFSNSDIIQLDRKGITLADIKHIINQRTQRAVYTMGTQSAVGASMSQNDAGSVLILADGTGNIPGDVCTIISRSKETSDERWAQHQYESVVETQEQVTVNGSLIARDGVTERVRTTIELRAPAFEQSATLTDVPMATGTMVVLPNDGQSSSIIIHDATTEQVLLNLANDGMGWYITGMVPNNWFASIYGDVFNPAMLAMSPQKWAYTHQTNLNYFYPVFVANVFTAPIVAPVGTTTEFSETPIPGRKLGIHLNHELDQELAGLPTGETPSSTYWDLVITVGNYRYLLNKNGAGTNFQVYKSFERVGTPDGWGFNWLEDTTAKPEVTVTPDNFVRILSVTSPEGYFGIAYNRLFGYMTYLNGDSDLTMTQPVYVASYAVGIAEDAFSGMGSHIQPAWVDYHTFVPTSYMWQEVPTYRLPFIDGVPQYDRTSGEFYAAYNDSNPNNAEVSTPLVAPTTMGAKMVLWTPTANQLLIEHCRDLLIETKLELQAARGNELSTIAGLLTQILAKP